MSAVSCVFLGTRHKETIQHIKSDQDKTQSRNSGIVENGMPKTISAKTERYEKAAPQQPTKHTHKEYIYIYVFFDLFREPECPKTRNKPTNKQTQQQSVVKDFANKWRSKEV